MFLFNWIILMVILQTMGWFLKNPNHGYFYNQHSHRLVHTCRKSPSLNWSYNNTMKWKANKVAPVTVPCWNTTSTHPLSCMGTHPVFSRKLMEFRHNPVNLWEIYGMHAHEGKEGYRARECLKMLHWCVRTFYVPWKREIAPWSNAILLVTHSVKVVHVNNHW